jgi:peptide/nickel transport system ATP-binding protein
VSETLLEVDDLHVSFRTEEGTVKAVDGVTFSVARGEVVAIVGESGSGKSVTAMTLMGLTRGPNARFDGTATFDGTELVKASEEQLQRIRGAGIAMVFQDPMSSLNPVQRIGKQIVEQIRTHDHQVSKAEAMDRAAATMERVGIPRAKERLRSYPHEFSGGMRQRVVIAIALACAPRLLMADEPTTGLDVTVQAQILDLLSSLQTQRQMAMVLVTHDLGVVATRTDEIIVMYAGNVVERAPTHTLFNDMAMPYTEALLHSTPRLANPSHTRLKAIDGRPPDLMYPPAGCPFSPRCPYVQDKCHVEKPPLVQGSSPDHQYACWFPLGSVARRDKEPATT